MFKLWLFIWFKEIVNENFCHYLQTWFFFLLQNTKEEILKNVLVFLSIQCLFGPHRLCMGKNRKLTLFSFHLKWKWKFKMEGQIQHIALWDTVGLGDISHAIVMRISSVKPVPWLAVNLHHLFSNGAAFNTQSRSSLTSYAISRSESQMNRCLYIGNFAKI